MSQQVRSKRTVILGLWRKRWVKVVLVLVAVLAIYGLTRPKGEQTSTNTLFTAKRGNLTINVLEGGNVEARESQTIKSEIRGDTKILSIVDEGYLVTPQDVADKKVLVTLDSSGLDEKATQETIQYESARADYAESIAQYEITIKQNESEIKKAELDAKFALLDFQKYLGDDIAGKILKERGLSNDVSKVTEEIRAMVEATAIIPEASMGTEEKDEAEPAAPVPADVSEQAAAAPKGDADKAKQPEISAAKEKGKTQTAKAVEVSEESTEGGDLPAETTETPASAPPSVAMTSISIADKRPDIDFSKFARPDALGDGAAQQQLRKLESSRLLAEGDLGLSETKLVGTRKLAEKNFVTKQELDNDEMSVQKNTVNRDSALTEQELFVKYEFPKEAEKLMSAYEEAIRAMERTMKQAVAKEAQADARRKSSEASFGLRSERRKELEDQLLACTLVAERPGLVVYAGSDEPWRNRERIEEGATVNERQEIITIPDMTQMAVRVKIHESNIKKLQIGQKAKIKLDSYPDEELEGEVIKLSVIPDSSSRWMNPDMKLYPATVAIGGTYDWLKPGMSAQVDIVVKELSDVVYVPIQAVIPIGRNRVCYVIDALGRQEEREVQTGDFNNDFIEIRSGLKEGERVMLRAPDSSPTTTTEKKEENESKPAEGATPESQPAAAERSGGAGGGEGRGNGEQRGAEQRGNGEQRGAGERRGGGQRGGGEQRQSGRGQPAAS